MKKIESEKMANHGGAIGTEGRNFSAMIVNNLETYDNESTARDDRWKELRIQAKMLLTTDRLETLPECDTNAFHRLRARCSLRCSLVKEGSLYEV